MPTMTNQDYANAYRRLADLLEANPTMAHPYQGSRPSFILMFAYSAEAFRTTIKAFGCGDKEDGGDTLNFVPDFPLVNKSFNLSYAGNDL